MNKNFLLAVFGVVVVAGIGLYFFKHNKVEQKMTTPIITQTSSNTTLLPGKPIKITQDNSISFSKEITLKVKEKITFPDGLNVTLDSIRDSRCAKNTVCVWAGELGGVFSLSGGKFLQPDQRYFGTTTQITTLLNGYTFTIKNATLTTATIEVLKAK